MNSFKIDSAVSFFEQATKTREAADRTATAASED